MALKHAGQPAVALSGAQAGIGTDHRYGRARILKVNPSRVRKELEAGNIVIVAGFQGLSEEMELTTLGRGGSDTTAVALAAALDASVCEIYTDVTGVFTADPRVEPGARKLHLVSHEEMLEMAASGSRVLALRSVEFARRHDVPLHVRSSFLPEEGTWITKETPDMEKAIVTGLAHRSDEAKVTVAGLENRPGVAARIFTTLADLNVNVDTIIQNQGGQGGADVTFTVPLDELHTSMDALETLRGELGFRELTSDDQIGKVTLVGAGMKSEPGVAAKMFRVLAEQGINLQMIDTSTIRITVVIDRREVERAVRALHDAFDLASEAARRESAEPAQRADV
jgi:aspartate kinase